MNVHEIDCHIFVDLWINNAAYCRSPFLAVLDPVTSPLWCQDMSDLAPGQAGLGWSPPRPQQPRLNADTPLPSTGEETSGRC